ncbi:hypothetical protein ACM66B_004884 [Microbotryomycetes sp. NB124-2]
MSSASGSSVVSGLGITFEFEGNQDCSNLLQHQHDDLSVVAVENDGVVAGSIAQQFSQHARQRLVRHSVSVDDGLRGLSNYRKQQQRHPHHRRGRSNGGGSHQLQHQHSNYSQQDSYVDINPCDHYLIPPVRHGGSAYSMHGSGLSPLTEPEHSTSSSSESEARDYSPASLSSMPSSNFGQYAPSAVHALAAAGNYEPQWDDQQKYNQHALVVNPVVQPATDYSFLNGYPLAMEPPHWVPPPPLVNEDLYNGSISPTLFDRDQQDLTLQQYESQQKQTRLPAFLIDKRSAATRTDRHERMSKAKSMHELGRAYQNSIDSRDDDSPQEQSSPYDDGSPAESVPSSAGGLQRRNLEKQLQEQKRMFEEEKRRLRHSTNASTDSRRRDEAEATSKFEAKRLARQRSRSMCATDKIPRVPSKDQLSSEKVAQGVVEPRRKSDGGARMREQQSSEADGHDSRPASTIRTPSSQATAATPVSTSTSSASASVLVRQSTLMSANANPVRRSKELDRLLAPSEKTRLALASLPSIAASPDLSADTILPTPSTVITTSSARLSASASSARTSSAAATSTRSNTRRSAAVGSNSPVMLEQAASNGKARVEIDLLLENVLVVEGGELRGKLNVRVKSKHGQVWVSRPKIRVVGFEELASEEVRHVFYHHATTLNGGQDDLRYCSGEEDGEGFRLARAGECLVPFAVRLPVGKGAKGSIKSKQCSVKYIAIASIKLKSPLGYERSIAHFYRQIDVFPFYNPAVVLAPALKPLVASESKSLFMGGNGKVKVTAKLHRRSWVAGQRCYVDLSVENGSSKKIKTLTLSLIRSTTILRPRPYLGTQVVPAALASDPEYDNQGGVPTQTTKKKVAESSLEMGKKASKGVTAKGSWLGVESGETADFSHFFLVPPDELSIARGRHVEVSYAVKASVGSSLSADVSAEIPVRIVSFLSLDPPPGHIGDASSADPEAHSLARTWSLEQLRPSATSASTKPVPERRQVPTLRGITSLDSLRLTDLNLGKVSRAPGLSRVASMDTIRTEDLSRAQSVKENNAPASFDGFMVPSRRAPLPPLPRHEAVVGRALEKQLAHRMSLECLSSVVASATARRRGAGVGSSLEPSPELHPLPPPPRQRDVVHLDDFDEVPDDNVYYMPASHAPLGDDIPCIPIMDDSESEDELELDAVMQSKFSDDEEDDHDAGDTERRYSDSSDDEEHDDRSSECAQRIGLSESFPRPPAPDVIVSKASSPAKDTTTSSTNQRRFSFATPASPVKANAVELSTKPSPAAAATRRPRDAPLAPPPRSAARSSTSSRSSSAATSPTFSSPTKASVAREQAASTARHELFKKPSGTSLKRSPGVVRRQSNKSLAEAAGADVSVSSSAASGDNSPSATGTSETAVNKSSSPTIAVTAPTSPVKRSPRPPSLAATSQVPTPRRVLKTPSPSLRAARSMGDLRSTASMTSGQHQRPALPPLPSARRPVVLPSVQSKVAALEQRQAVLHKLSPTKRVPPSASSSSSSSGTTAAAHVKRTNSILSDVSATTSSETSGLVGGGFGLSELQRGNSVMSFKAPLLRQ